MGARTVRGLGIAAGIFFVCAALVPRSTAARPAESWRFASFGQVAIFTPDRAPEEVVLFISGDGG